MASDIRTMPEGFGGTEFQNIDNIHPLGLAATVILGLVMLCIPRRWSLFPMLIIACFISSVQKVTLFDLDFNLLRIMVIFGIVRLFFNKEYLSFVWTTLDGLVIFWTLSSMIFYVIREGTVAALVNRLGFAFDSFGMYFLFRCLVKDWQDVETVIFGALLISFPLASFFLLENRTGHNLFSIFGGVPEITMIRNERLRCQGAFSHPILAGCFWASLIPLFAAFWWKSAKYRIWAIIGLLASSIIVLCCASSTPMMAVLMAIVGGLFFYLRHQMRLVRWTILLLLIFLHMVMNAPVWHLISRISAVGGSTGYFQYILIDSAIKHFSEWAMAGTNSTANWFWGAQDICNQYVMEGITGGIWTLGLYVAVIAFAFKQVGILWRSQKKSPYRVALSWALGVSLFVHCMNFIGVSYFGQIWILWYLLLAIIGSLSVHTSTAAITMGQTSTGTPGPKGYNNRKPGGVGNNVN